MNNLDRISNNLYAMVSRYLEWLINSPFELLHLPQMTMITFGLWMLVFLLWFITKSINVGEDSKVELLLKGLEILIFLTLLSFLASIAFAAIFVGSYLNNSSEIQKWLLDSIISPLLVSLILMGVFSVVLGWFSLRNWIPAVNGWIIKQGIKKSYHESGISDIRDVAKQIPNAKDYNPLEYWDKTKQSIFIGLDPANKPVYVPLDEWQTQHQQVLGTTGFGKGVAVTNQLAQCLAFGQTAVVFDPKNDEWAPSVLLSVAEQYNRPVCIINLNNEAPQFNPMFGANEMEIYDLFIGGFGLAERGAESDFFRSKERRVIQQWLPSLSKDVSLKALSESLTETDYDNAEKLCNDLTELAMLGAIHTNQKGNWYDILDQGGLVYVIGSVRREPVLRLQKILLLRIMQRLEQRDRSKANRHVTIFLDELKYLLCKPSLQALGTIRDKSANILLAHQSINDLRDVPADLDPEAVKSAVMENTALKIVYRSQDPETAEWIAKRSGTIPAHKEIRDIETTEGFAEITKNNRKLIEVERYLVETNTILRLPKRCSVFFSNESAQIVLTSPIKVEKREIVPSVVNKKNEKTHKLDENITKLDAFK